MNALRRKWLVGVLIAWAMTLGHSDAQVYLWSTLAGNGHTGTTDGAGSESRFNSPTSVAVDRINTLYIADSRSHTIRKITPSGMVTTWAGLAGHASSADGAGGGAGFYYPSGVAVDSSNNVYVADTFNDTIRMITPAGLVSTIAGLAGREGSTDGLVSQALFYRPGGVAVDSSNNVYVADTGNHTIRMITPEGTVTTLAGQAGQSGSADGAGSLALFDAPTGVAVDSSHNVYVADTRNNTIRVITPDGQVRTVAGVAGQAGGSDGLVSEALFSLPGGVAVDRSNNVYVADTRNNTIRLITSNTVVTTIGGLARSSRNLDGVSFAARFNRPWGIAAGQDGSVYVADTSNKTIRVGTLTPAPVKLRSVMFKAKLNFLKTGSDRFYLKATLDLDANFDVAKRLSLGVDAGGARLTFGLYQGRGKSTSNSARLVYNTNRKVWTLTVEVNNGDFRSVWGDYGMENKDVAKPGVTINLPVIVMVGSNLFADEKSLTYTAKKDKSSTAK